MNREQDLNLWSAKYGHVKRLDYEMTILPWGSMEPHNYHLPYLTDSIIAEEISIGCANELLEKHNLRCMVLPSVNFGSQNLGQIDLPFCIHTSYQTQFGILKDIVTALDRQGIYKLLIINGHGGNCFKNMLRDLTVEFPKMLVCASSWFDMVDMSRLFNKPGNHADEVETSMIMYFRDGLVRLNEAGSGNAKVFNIPALNEGRIWTPRNWSRVSVDTGIGDPSLATKEKGKKCAELVIEKYTEFCFDLITKPLYSKK